MKYIVCLILLVLSNTAHGQKFLFEENKGQWHDDVLFRTHIPGGYLFITKTGMKYLYIHPDDLKKFHGHGSENKTSLRTVQANSGVRMQAIEVEFLNISKTPVPEKISPQSSYSNYFIGNDPSKWASDVKKYEQVTLKNVYPGIHLKFYNQNENLKYDLIIDPKADPSKIEMRYKGASDLKLTEEKLEVYTDFGKSLELQPISFQHKNRQRINVSCNYYLNEDKLSFKFPQGYDKKMQLVIDPALIFSTYSGSLADNWGFTATFDEEGNLYSGGIGFATGYPTTTGAYQENYGGNTDATVLKFDTTGTQLLFATYLGGSEADTPQNMIIDNNGDLVIYGTTSSVNFPISSTAFQNTFSGGFSNTPVSGVAFTNGSDIYLLKLSSDGKNLEGSTYLGGSDNDGMMFFGQALTKNYGDQFRGEVNVDADNNIYIASYTGSTDFPIVNGYQNTFGGGSHDGLIVKMNPGLSQILWSSFLGGSDMDGLYSIKIDDQNNVYVGGGTTSLNYPVTAGAYKTSKSSLADIDGVISKLSADGKVLLSSTLVGTSSYDQVYFIDIDTLKNIYALGQTQGNYPVSAGVYSNSGSCQFIHKLRHSLDSTIFSTVIGSGRHSPDFRPTAFLVNDCENLLISGWGGNVNSGYVGGSTFSLPVTENAFQKTTDGSDFYLMVLLQDAKQLLYATYIGENGGRGDHVDGGTSRFDKKGIVYQSVCASCGGSDNFPTTPGAWSAENNSIYPSENCNNAVFKFDLSQLIAKLDTESLEYDHPGINSGCAPLDVIFLNKSIGGIDFFWDFGNGHTSTQKDSIPITYETPGIYKVSLKATDIATCVREDFDYGTITVFDQEFDIMEPTKICFGNEIVLNAEGGISYHWEPAEYLNNPNIKNPLAKPDTTMYFKATITNDKGCSQKDSVLITVVPDFTVDFSFSKENTCFDTPNITFFNNSEGAESFTWNLGDGNILEEDSLTYNYHKTDTFTVQLKGRLDICEKIREGEVPSVKTFVPNIITPNADGKNDHFEIITAEPVDLKIFNRWGKSVFEEENYLSGFNGDGLTESVYYYEIKFKEDGTSCFGWLQILK